MSSSQISVAMDRWLRDRLRSAADRRRMTVSELARVLVRDGLDRPYEQQNLLNHKMIEEVLLSLFGIEELIVRGYMEPIESPKPDKNARLKIIKTADDNARAKTNELMEMK